MRVASIDIGTNTVLLLIADTNGGLKTIYEDQKIIRLGKSVDAHRVIGEEGFWKLVDVLLVYRDAIEQYGCQHTIVAATSAMRDAGNRDEFIENVHRATGLRIDVISGEEEALSSFLGGRMVLPETDKQSEVFLIDIGGGSTEFILGNGSSIHQKISLDMGSVRLTERFLKNDPVDTSEEATLRQFVRAELETHLKGFSIPPGTVAIGVAGTITTAATMAMKLAVYDREKVSGFVIRLSMLDDLLDELRRRDLTARKHMPGLHPERADIIFAGLVILRESMAFFGFDSLTASHFGLRYGLIQQFLRREKQRN